MALAQKGNLDRALSDFDKAIQLDGSFTLAYVNRAVTYGQKGDINQAISDLTTALKLAHSNGSQQLISQIQSRLAFYKSSLPYRGSHETSSTNSTN